MMIRIILFSHLFISLLLCSACSKDADTPVKEDPLPSEPTINIDQSITYQEMIGFGGALTWYCDRITNSVQKEAMTDLFFKDLGIDILRLKNWYYPVNYTVNKSSDEMEPNWFGNHFKSTNELFEIAKAKSPNIEVLFSSWGPPPALKSNNHLNEGTLKKNQDGTFMYAQFGQYFEDIFDHITFTPDYLSIQNEPSYTNPGWETCNWRATETISYPGYDRGIDAVYDHLKNLPVVPSFIGPESPNISNTTGGKSFFQFSEAIRNKSYLEMYAWHPYNFDSGSSVNSTPSLMKKIRDDFGDRPNMMTEFSDNYGWLETAWFINNSLVYANTSAYIYWKLMWGVNDDGHTMVYVSSSGEYEVRPFYYLVKHFSKFIDKGYVRIDAVTEEANLKTSAFMSPDKKQMTIIVINISGSSEDFKLLIPNTTVKSHQVFQSVEGSGQLFNQLNNLDLSEIILLPGKSVSTFVLTI